MEGIKQGSDPISSVFGEGPAGRRGQWGDTLGGSLPSQVEGRALEWGVGGASVAQGRDSVAANAQRPESPRAPREQRITQHTWRAGFEGWEGPQSIRAAVTKFHRLGTF